MTKSAGVRRDEHGETCHGRADRDRPDRVLACQDPGRRVPDAELVAVADARPEAARALADELGVEAHPDPAALIADPRIEAVVIAAATPAHVDLVVAAAEAGKAVFCEKPMALTIAEADRAVAAAETAGVPLQVGFNRRFAPDFAAAHDAVVDGTIGTPHQLRSHHPRPRAGRTPAACRRGRSSCSPSSTTSTCCSG